MNEDKDKDKIATVEIGRTNDDICLRVALQAAGMHMVSDETKENLLAIADGIIGAARVAGQLLHANGDAFLSMMREHAPFVKGAELWVLYNDEDTCAGDLDKLALSLATNNDPPAAYVMLRNAKRSQLGQG